MVMAKKKRIAVFDIDGTIFRSSLMRELLEAFITFGIFPYRAHEHYIHTYVQWLDRKGSYSVYQQAIIRAFQRYIKGIHQNMVREVSSHVLDFHRYRVYHHTKNLVRDLKKKGFYLIAISGSPEDAVTPFAKNMGFDEVHGRIFATNKLGQFTGKISNQKQIGNKNVILKKILADNPALTLEGSVGVGDTDLDISFLKLVERPIAFNPNKKLYLHAKKNNWEIVVERKDMILKSVGEFFTLLK
jgi:HAD superfamily phosphoserine phosphatase-like hydrolase